MFLFFPTRRISYWEDGGCRNVTQSHPLKPRLEYVGGWGSPDWDRATHLLSHPFSPLLEGLCWNKVKLNVL